MKKLWFVTAILVVLSIGFGFAMGSVRSTLPPETSSREEESIVSLVNKVRAENGVPALREDAGLDETSKIKATDMDVRNYWNHADPDGKPFQLMLLEKRPGLKLYGENLAECFESNEETVEAWKGSAGHLKNMIEPRYNIMGSSTVWDQDRTCLITVNHFGEE